MILATLCYLQHAVHTLMLQHTKRAIDILLGKWHGLSGKFEPGENPELCVIRELREESGLEIQSLPRWPSDHLFLPWIRQDRFFSARFVYAGDEMQSHTVTFHDLYPCLGSVGAQRRRAFCFALCCAFLSV